MHGPQTRLFAIGSSWPPHYCAKPIERCKRLPGMRHWTEWPSHPGCSKWVRQRRGRRVWRRIFDQRQVLPAGQIRARCIAHLQHRLQRAFQYIFSGGGRNQVIRDLPRPPVLAQDIGRKAFIRPATPLLKKLRTIPLLEFKRIRLAILRQAIGGASCRHYVSQALCILSDMVTASGLISQFVYCNLCFYRDP